MALEPNRWTHKTQEALTRAVESAKAESNPEVTPDHLLLALLGQEEGIVLPILQRVGVAPLSLRNATTDALRSEERRVGKECVSSCRSRVPPAHVKQMRQSTPTSTEETRIKAH